MQQLAPGRPAHRRVAGLPRTTIRSKFQLGEFQLGG
jgi:hypothetical protein